MPGRGSGCGAIILIGYQESASLLMSEAGARSVHAMADETQTTLADALRGKPQCFFGSGYCIEGCEFGIAGPCLRAKAQGERDLALAKPQRLNGSGGRPLCRPSSLRSARPASSGARGEERMAETECGVFIGPAPRERIIHRAKLINPGGGVSPL